MNGKEVFKHAVREMEQASRLVLDEAGITAGDIKLMVPHQANSRIIELTAKRLGIPMDKVFLNIEKYGNTSAASVPIALSEAYESGLIKGNDYVIDDSLWGRSDLGCGPSQMVGVG